MPEQRRSPRIAPYVAPCRVVDGTRRLPGYLTDLSRQGARVSCDAAPPRPGSPVVVEVRFGRQVRYSRLPAEVKWVQSGGEGQSHGLGLVFGGVSAAERRVIDSVVEEFERRASQIG